MFLFFLSSMAQNDYYKCFFCCCLGFPLFFGQNQFFMIWLVLSRPGRSQGLLYKHLRYSLIHSFIDSVSLPFPPIALRRRHAQTIRDSSSSYKIDYLIVIKTFLNPEGHQNCTSGSNVTAILLKG